MPLLHGLLLLLVTATTASCDAPREGEREGEREVGTLVATWSEADAPGLGQQEPRRWLLTAADHRAEFLAGLPSELDTAAVAAVDLDTHLIVAGAWHRCAEESRVTAEPLRFEIYAEEDVDCVWAPLTIQVWSVLRDDLDDVPDRLADPGE